MKKPDDVAVKGCISKRMPGYNGRFMDRGSRFALTRKCADMMLAQHNKTEGMPMNTGNSTTLKCENLANCSLLTQWECINWKEAEARIMGYRSKL